jgi:hypothetical protein
MSGVHMPAKLWGNGIGILLRSVCVLANIYAAPLDVVLTRMLRAGTQGAIPARMGRTIQDGESELPRIPVPRTWVNKPM